MPNNTKISQNWFQTAFNQVPKGEASNKIDKILEACSISLATFYNWKKSGEVPNQITKDAILNILKVETNQQTTVNAQ